MRTSDLDDMPLCANCGCKAGYWFGKPVPVARDIAGEEGHVVAFEKNSPCHVSVIDWEQESLADFPGDISVLPCEPCKCGCTLPDIRESSQHGDSEKQRVPP